jgi:hypothetical protein
MKRHINFGSVEQFRNVVQSVKWTAQYQGEDEDGQPIMDRGAKLPTVKAIGSETIHGTNAAVCYSIPDGFWVQSRSGVVTPENDNAACAFNVMSVQKTWMDIIETLAKTNDIDLTQNIISVFFEWCGGNIQKNTCVDGEEKMSIIFRHFKVSPLEKSDDVPAVWYETNGVECQDERIFNVMHFPTFEIEVDFDDLEPTKKKLEDLVEQVENKSGIAKHFGKPDNIGEGIVFTFLDARGNLQRWKSKGERHNVTKVQKQKTPVDSEKEAARVEFANYAVTAGRCEQAWNEVFGLNNEKEEPSMKSTGDFIKWIIADVMKEELDVMSEKGLEPKEVNGLMSKIARDWFFEQLNKHIGA